MKRGEVYWADLAPRSGSEQQGRRPVIVISHDAFNHTQSWRSIIVVPLSTSVAQTGRGPSAVLLPQRAAGLGKNSVALCHQVTTLDPEAYPTNWRIEFNGAESGRRWSKGCDGPAVGVR
jgi:mRNA interferase MazF